MKTRISIPEEIFRAAGAASRRMGMSRSQLFTEAMRLFLRTHGNRDITDELNDVHGGTDSKLDAMLSRLQWTSIRQKW